jgi:hypothetical protein
MNNQRTIARALLRQLAPWQAQELMERALADKTGLQGFIDLAIKQVCINEQLVDNL